MWKIIFILISIIVGFFSTFGLVVVYDEDAKGFWKVVLPMMFIYNALFYIYVMISMVDGKLYDNSTPVVINNNGKVLDTIPKTYQYDKVDIIYKGDTLYKRIK